MRKTRRSIPSPGTRSAFRCGRKTGRSQRRGKIVSGFRHLPLIGFLGMVLLMTAGCSLPFRAVNTAAGLMSRSAGAAFGAAKSGMGVLGRGAGTAVSAARAYPYYKLFGFSPESVLSEEPEDIP